MRPVPLPANPVERFYRGGARIAELRGEEVGANACPRTGSARPRPCTAPGAGSEPPEDGTLLGDLIPAGIPLLVKLLDAGERLPVHVHPDGDFARSRLDAPCGKTEAWFVISADGPDPCVWLGLREAVGHDQLSEWVEGQDIKALLVALDRVPVQAGRRTVRTCRPASRDREGVLICELQEPSDLSLLFEWRGLELEGADPYLGLGLAGALDATRREPLLPAGKPGADRRLLPPEADEFFRLERNPARWLRNPRAGPVDTGGAGR